MSHTFCITLRRNCRNSGPTETVRCPESHDCGLCLLSNVISGYRSSLRWSRRAKREKKTPKCRTTILDIVPPSPAPPLATKPRPSLFDPDRNLVGWCYRKPDAPGKIVLPRGDSSLLTSSLIACLKTEGEGKEERLIGWWKGVRGRESGGQSDLIHQ